ncbi:unnamed protein product [Eruca vesicaria subsp. sativa]|uniref:Uncharacterized protein n=1 Tax=Eruca vesicaria subsp. sativa TaxID=29727 RepID=A0ABC8LVU9_ERUVS|nr:unnamed protein product [Eruca vesicaria subsp. sativa]
MIFSLQNAVVFPYISCTGNNDVIAEVKFIRDDEKKDERVNKIMAMLDTKADWSKVVWETEQPILPQEEDHAVVADEEDHAFVADDKAPSEKDEPVEPVVKRSVKRKVKDPASTSPTPSKVKSPRPQRKVNKK